MIPGYAKDGGGRAGLRLRRRDAWGCPRRISPCPRAAGGLCPILWRERPSGNSTCPRLPCLLSPDSTVKTPDPDDLAKALAALGYPGFAYLKSGRRTNPAQLLLTALSASDLEVRLAEGLPWVVWQHPI